MNKQIWKYELFSAPDNTHYIPAGAQILCAQMQKGGLYLWALVDPDAPQEKRTFGVFGTGCPIPVYVQMKYIGTVQQHGCDFVLHVFDITEDET